MPPRSFAVLALVALPAAVAGGCTLAPAYAPPSVVVATPAYREAGPWTPAAPADAQARGAWWRVFGDPVLDDLEQRLEAGGPDLAAALARYDQASALARRARAARSPSVDAIASVERYRNAGQSRQDDSLVEATAAYELDLWGRVRNLVAAGRAEAQASGADLASARLSLQAQLADTYFQLRGLDGQILVLTRTADAYEKALALTDKRFRGGASSAVDVGRARTQLAATQAQYEQALADRALLEHAIAALVGESASRFTLATAPDLVEPPRVPVDAPSSLLQRRPDVAAAERRMAAANARIGVARAAAFPSLTLAATGGFESAGGDLLSASNRQWALGPVAVGLPLLDGGARRADVAASRAAFEEQAALYRKTVLDAFREVEDQLALANRLATAEARQAEAVDAAMRTNVLATTRYREGATSYLDVVIAQTAELDARRTALDLRTRRLAAGVDLIRALGGGWDGTPGPSS
ncbi:efflux transporter outer membrane subunit [Caulobacter sp. BE254]|uniref:efflux transporter outer membrane subunit n=1 Tax=Caulobacter sp. BE254 TaxID=2817720 RepID=UPI002856E4C2|nr:efflux transporter outer membrane subunit [Caulobacter sp. BE254]MDR7116078.1 NodT family efflux transporter outer membrane factor (OMF) lipoprotein [Caulobacter sp. BE254]